VIKALSPSLLTWLRAFDASARHGSFTRAADELCITQGAISQQVKHLEQSLGFPLLLREPHALELTPEGRKLATVATQAFGALREVLSEIAAPGGRVPVTLSSSPSFAMRWVTPRLSSMLAHHPTIDLRVFGEFHRLSRARMIMDGVEAAIRYDDTSYAELLVAPFLDEYLVPVASLDFVASHPKLKRAADLDGRLLLHDAQPWFGASDDEEWRAYLSGVNVEIPNLALGNRFNLSLLSIGAALAGEGIAIGRLALVMDDLEAGRLVPLFDTAVRAKASYKFISLIDRPPRIAAIGEWLREEARTFVQRTHAFLEANRLTARPAQ